MLNYINGLPAQGGLLVSGDIRNNFQALNARTDRLTAQATIPSSTKIKIGSGVVYFANKIVVEIPETLLDLGDPYRGVSSFSEKGNFKDIVIVARLNLGTQTNPDGYITSAPSTITKVPTATICFIEGPEKTSSIPEPQLVFILPTDIPITSFIVRQNGVDGSSKGQIQPINQSELLDYRNFVDAGAITYFSASVGDRRIARDGSNTLIRNEEGFAQVDGYSIGEFNDIQSAVDIVAALGGGTVFIKKGVYDLLSPLNLSSNVSLVGEGAATIINGIVQIGKSTTTTTSASISSINLQNNSSSSATNSYPVRLVNAQCCSITNCILNAANADTAIYFEGTTGIYSQNNTCTNNYIYNATYGVRFSTTQTRKNLFALNQLIDCDFEKLDPENTNTSVNNIT